jgi:hypothetical protein
MSYELFTRGQQEPEKIKVRCPECGKVQDILWFPPFQQTYRIQGTTGSSSHRTDRKKERVEGNCECGYKFKPENLD